MKPTHFYEISIFLVLLLSGCAHESVADRIIRDMDANSGPKYDTIKQFNGTVANTYTMEKAMDSISGGIKSKDYVDFEE